ncbi:General secretion pathway protein H [gamma proteobacterium IMCC2047]|nr:General secretion pathway protein H [gamma proteobacterium IMCC2047]
MVKRCRGFTLVEILVVMVIVGLMAGMAVLALGGDPRQQVKQEAQRIRSVLQLAADEALMSGQEYGIKLAEQEYQVVRFDDHQQRWIKAEQEAFAAYQLSDEISLSLQSEGSQVDLAALNKSVEELELEKRNPQQDQLKPSLLLLSSGETTPFSLQLTSADNEHHIQLVGDGLGNIRIGYPHDD